MIDQKTAADARINQFVNINGCLLMINNMDNRQNNRRVIPKKIMKFSPVHLLIAFVIDGRARVWARHNQSGCLAGLGVLACGFDKILNDSFAIILDLVKTEKEEVGI